MEGDYSLLRISKLGFKPQKELVYNRLLPHADKIDDEALQELNLIKTNLVKCLLAREVKPGFYLWTIRLEQFIKLYGLMFSKEDHINFIKLYLEVLSMKNMEAKTAARWCSTLGILLKKRYLISQDELEIDWRIFYNLYLEFRENTKSDVGIYKDRTSLEVAVKNVSKLCRIYFRASATQEILDECKPHLCPFDEAAMTEYLSILEVLLPTFVREEEIPVSCDLWFEDLMQLWTSCINDATWENSMMTLMARLSYHNMGSIDFDPYIPLMYARFTRAFQLPVSYKMRVSSKTYNIDVHPIAMWIVGTLNNKTEISFNNLENFMHMIKSFLYCANSGRWTAKLKELFNKLSSCFVSRVYIERYRPKSWEKQIPEEYKLTDSDIDRFVLILKPCLEIAMFSRRMAGDLNVAFQNLASLRPKIIVPMTLEKLYSSLDSLTEPHRLISAMSVVIAVARNMVEGFKTDYPEGPTHVIPLLMAVLPGIDSNDFRKCVTTFSFLSQIISMVPIINCSDAFNYYDDLTDEEHIICEATAGFEDFVIQLIDRICVWIESSSLAFVRPDHQTGDVRGSVDALSEQMMSYVVVLILRQCSPEIFTAALKKVFNFMTNNIFEVNIAGRLTAFLCSCFSKVQPKESLKLFIPFLCDKIESLFHENVNAQTEENLDGELLYNLLILSEVVDGRGEIINYIEPLMKILKQTLHITCEKATKLSVHLLKVLVATLAAIEPSERKSVGKSYSLHTKDFLPIKDWAHSIYAKDLDVEWYTPGEVELKTIESLLKEFLLPELDKLDKYSIGELTLSRIQLRTSLKILSAFMTAPIILPMWEETPIHIYESVAHSTSFRIAETETYNIFMPDGGNIRKTIADTLHKVQKKLLEIDEGDTKSSFGLSSLYQSLLFNKTVGVELDQHWKNFFLVKKFCRNRLLDRKRHFRHILIDRVALQQYLRIESRTYSITPTHKQILFDLFELGVSRYRNIRVHSQARLSSMINHYPYCYTLLTDKFKEILQTNTEENHDRFKGCLYILNNSKNASIMVKSNWQFLCEIWPLVVKSMPSEKPSIINLITSISETVSGIRVTNFNFDVADEGIRRIIKMYENLEICSNFSDEKNMESIRGREKIRDTKIESYNKCLDSLLEACSDRNLHWRYRLLAVGFIKDMVHMDVKYNHLVAKYFLDALIDDSILIRKIALRVVLFILIQNKVQFKKIEIDPLKFSNADRSAIVPGHREDNKWLLYDAQTLPKSSDEWNELRYLHGVSDGYYTWPKTVNMYASPEDQPRLDENPDEMSLVQKELFNFFTDENNVSKLIYYFSLEDKKGKDRFNIHKVLIFNYLSKLFGDKILNIFLPHLEKLAIEKQESSQRCAAEIVCGVIKGSKHWTYEKTEQLWFRIIPILQGANQNILQETIPDWALCIASSLHGRDSRRCHWILEFLLDDPLSDPTSLVAGVKIHLLSFTLSLQPWRNCELYGRLLEYLKKYLAHPFQLLRMKISSALKMIFTRDYMPPGGTLDRNPKIKDFIDECMPTLERLYTDTLNKLDNNTNCDTLDGPNKDASKREESLRLFKIICKFVVDSLLCRHNLYTSFDFYRILPLTCVLQSNDVDDELQPLCRNFIAILAVTLIIPNNIPSLLEIFDGILSCPLWSARLALADFFSTFIFHNMSIFASNTAWVDKIQSYVMILLEDSQPEVRDSACKLLSGLLHCNFLPSPSELLADFKVKAKTKLKKSKSVSTVASISTFNLIARHAGVLGLCAFISSTPYDVPEFIPEIFGLLGPHLSDPQPIPGTIRKTLCDFKRTHQDNWEVHKTQFTEEQLHILRDLTVPPSYYV